MGRLQQSLDVPGDVTYTCETAGHFYLHQILARWESYHLKLAKLKASITDDLDATDTEAAADGVLRSR